MPSQSRPLRQILLFSLLGGVALVTDAEQAAVPAQLLSLPSPREMTELVQVAELMPGAIADVKTSLVSVKESQVWRSAVTPNVDQVLLFLAGEGTYRARGEAHAIREETVARAPLSWPIEVEAAPGSVLHFFWIRKQHHSADMEDLARFPQNNAAPWVRTFRECTPYGEAIKSKTTVSRTLLPEGYVPRVALGTVEAPGPDRVAPHRHPMLEQLFLGLEGNDSRVQADDAQVPFREFELLHIPLGSSHGVTVAEGKKLYYIWMDFFMTKEGQVHLQTHKPIEKP